METLKPCKSCGQSVSAKAEACPKCGRQRPGGGVSSGVMIVTVLIGAALVAYCMFRVATF